MNTFLQYILPSLIAAASALIASVVSIFVSKSKINNEIEKQQKQFFLDNAKHIRQMRNEERFKIYHSLSEKSLEMVQTALMLFPPFLDYVPKDLNEKNELYKNRYKEAMTSYNCFSKCLFSNAPFIDENLYKKLMNYREMCRLQIAFYPDLILKKSEGYDETNENLKSECWKRGTQIATIQEQIIADIRKAIQEDETIWNADRWRPAFLLRHL